MPLLKTVTLSTKTICLTMNIFLGKKNASPRCAELSKTTQQFFYDNKNRVQNGLLEDMSEIVKNFSSKIYLILTLPLVSMPMPIFPAVFSQLELLPTEAAATAGLDTGGGETGFGVFVAAGFVCGKEVGGVGLGLG